MLIPLPSALHRCVPPSNSAILSCSFIILVLSSHLSFPPAAARRDEHYMLTFLYLTHTDTHTQAHARAHTHTHTHTRTHTHMCTGNRLASVCIYSHTRHKRTHTQAHTQKRTGICTHRIVQEYAHTHTHTHTHTQPAGSHLSTVLPKPAL